MNEAFADLKPFHRARAEWLLQLLGKGGGTAQVAYQNLVYLVADTNDAKANEYIFKEIDKWQASQNS